MNSLLLVVFSVATIWLIASNIALLTAVHDATSAMVSAPAVSQVAQMLRQIADWARSQAH